MLTQTTTNNKLKNSRSLLQAFDLKEILYFDYKHLDDSKEKELNAKFTEMDDLIEKCDVITINLPLSDKTRYGCHSCDAGCPQECTLAV